MFCYALAAIIALAARAAAHSLALCVEITPELA
jgi:hypothetical protein